LQQGVEGAPWINTECQCFDAFWLGHPARNAEPSMLELDFDILSTIESMQPKDLQFLLIQGVERIENRNSTRIAGIIPAGWEARRTKPRV
jgi:hypothetical protein